MTGRGEPRPGRGGGGLAVAACNGAERLASAGRKPVSGRPPLR